MEYGRAISIVVDDERQYLDAMKSDVTRTNPINGGVPEWKKEWYPPVGVIKLNLMQE